MDASDKFTGTLDVAREDGGSSEVYDLATCETIEQADGEFYRLCRKRQCSLDGVFRLERLAPLHWRLVELPPYRQWHKATSWPA